MRNSTMEYKVNQAYEELKRLIQWNPDSEEKFLQNGMFIVTWTKKMLVRGYP